MVTQRDLRQRRQIWYRSN